MYIIKIAQFDFCLCHEPQSREGVSYTIKKGQIDHLWSATHNFVLKNCENQSSRS